MAADTSELMGHVKDATYFHLPNGTAHGLQVPIPQPYETAQWLGIEHPPQWLHNVQFTKFMLLELTVAVLMVAIFVPLARRTATGNPVRGRFWNFFEVILVFLRNEVTRPAIGGKDADRFLPFIWTTFFFILFCNLFGLIPWAGSPTGAWGCTLALAVIAFLTVIGSGMKKYGVTGFWLGQVPHMEVPLVMAIFVKPMVFVIEVVGLLIRHFVLSVRLLANMFAGHLVLAVVIGFIAVTADRNFFVWAGVTISSLFGAMALCLLELFVAFLQAYIFVFLSALFIGMAIHQH
jgi:F-type H+-transporting ATPase subunit a